jgi:hypothetical protein
VRLATIHPFISLTKRADSAFDVLDKLKRNTGLTPARVPTDRTGQTDLGQSAIHFGWFHGAQPEFPSDFPGNL